MLSSTRALVGLLYIAALPVCGPNVVVDDTTPTDCPAIGCADECPQGFTKDEDGCPTCECAPAPECEDLLCNLACPDGYILDEAGCPICECVSPSCEGPDPAGCVSTGCEAGEVCDTNLGCLPSGCSCDESSGSWGCTADCGGGTCVPDPSGCMEPYPGGCFETGCPIDQVCLMTSGVCIPSLCVCENGGWTCTDDCGGGVCGGP